MAANMRNTNRWDTGTLVTRSLFAAIGALLSFIEIGNFGGFLKYDASFVSALLAGLVFGPGAGTAVGVVAWAVHGLVTGDFLGALTNMVGIAFFVGISARIYRRNPSSASAIAGLAAACVFNLAVSTAMNLVIVPIYTHVAVADVVDMLVPLLLPFNLFKGVVDSALTFVLLGPVLAQAHRP